MNTNRIAASFGLPRELADFAPGLLAIQACPPSPLPRVVAGCVGALVFTLIAWAAFAKVDVVAVAAGRLVPASHVKIVQPAEAGIVKDLLVEEGQRVEQGQVLMRLDPTLAGADHGSLVQDLQIKRLSLRRIDAQLAGEELRMRPGDDPPLFAQVHTQMLAHQLAFRDSLAQEKAALDRARGELLAAQEELSKLHATSAISAETAEAHRRLVAEGFYSSLGYAQKEREAIEQRQDLKARAAAVEALQAAVAMQAKRVAALDSQYRNELLTQRTELLGSLNRLEQETRKSTYRSGLLELRAPQSGVVKDLATRTVGAVVQPGMVLLTLVPQGEALIAEVQIRNEDVGHVEPGAPVELKVSAFSFQKYGLLAGTVRSISPDATDAREGPDGRGPLSYKATIVLGSQTLKAPETERSHRLDAGMAVDAEIRLANRTVLEFLLSPIQRMTHEAARER